MPAVVVIPEAVAMPGLVGIPAALACKCAMGDDPADDASTAADDASTVASSETADAGVQDTGLDDFDETMKRWADINNCLGKLPWADMADSEDEDWSFLETAPAATSTIHSTGAQVDPTLQKDWNAAISAKAGLAVNAALGNSIRHRSGQSPTPAASNKATRWSQSLEASNAE